MFRSSASKISRSLLPFSFLALSFLALSGCGGSPTAPKQDDVFYLHGGGKLNKDESLEVYFAPLDAPETPRVPRTVGVGVLKGDVRLGRPIDWSIRSADYTAGQRFISYQSPRQFVFSIFERIDHPEDSWDDVLDRYEDDLEEQGATVLSGRMPIATANSQARSYYVKTTVPGRPPYQSKAYEILVRSEHRLLLVQIVYSGNIEAMTDEMVSAFKSMIVY